MTNLITLIRYASLGLASMMLTACDSSSNLPKSGAINDFVIIGIDYKSSSGSGQTDSTGQFQYKDGDSVQLSLAGEDLFSVQAAKNNSLSEALLSQLPTTQHTIETMLGSHNRYPDFHQLFNKLYFLTLIDADHNFDNGIDVSNFSTVGALSDVNFDMEIRDFVNNHSADFIENNPNASVSISASDLFALLFSALTIDIQLPTRISADFNNDGNENSYQSFTYNENNEVSLYLEDDDNDAWIDREYRWEDNIHGGKTETQIDRRRNDIDECFDRSLYQSTFDSENIEIASRSYSSNFSSGSPRSNQESTVTYDENNLVESRTTFIDGNINNISGVDGVWDAKLITNYTYNDDQTIASYVEDVYFGTNGEFDNTISEKRTFTAEYYDNGLFKQTTYIRDPDNNPDTANFTSINYSEYDEAGNTTFSRYQTDSDGDGVSDYGHLSYYTFDENGNTLSRRYENDNDGDPEIDDSYGYTYTYDERGLELTNDYFSDADHDGTPEKVRHYEYTYNEAGLLIEAHEYSDGNDADIELDSVERYYYTYDENNRETSEVIHYDDELDNIIDYFEAEYITYNSIGAKEQEKEESGDVVYQNDQIVQVIDSRKIEVYTFNDKGNVIDVTTERDNGADGSIDSTSITTFTYQDTNEGVEFLLERYLDPTYY